MHSTSESRQLWKKIFALLPQRQKLGFFVVLLILAVSAGLSQVTPLAIGYLTDHVLAQQNIAFASVVPILLGILLVNVVNEVIKVIRRLIVEDTATQAEKIARRKATDALLLAPLNYFRSHMTGNIHGRLNRSLEGTVKLIKLMFMDFAPAVTTGVAAIVTIFYKLPVPVALMVVLVIPVGTFIVFRQISTQKGIRVELMDTKAEMDGTMVELLGGIETIRALDSARDEGARIEDRAEALRKKEMRHHTAMAFYDCLKFVNEAVFSVLVIGVSVLLASRGDHHHRHRAHRLPLLYSAYRPPAGAAPHSGRVLRVHRAGGGLLPHSGPAPGLFLPAGGGPARPHHLQRDPPFRHPFCLPGKARCGDSERAGSGDPGGRVFGHCRSQRLRQVHPHQGH